LGGGNEGGEGKDMRIGDRRYDGVRRGGGEMTKEFETRTGVLIGGWSLTGI
jgi:hypothetical protein